MVYNCVVIDDFEVDRLMTVAFVKRCHQLNLIGAFESAKAAIETLEKNEIHVLFLDIDMPEMNGLELRRRFFNVPACIFITAHGEHALEGYEANALDFLLKPVKFVRFEQANKRLDEYLSIRHKASLFEASVGGDCVEIKEGRDTVRIPLSEILYLEALRDYTSIVTRDKKHHVLMTLGQLLLQPGFESFLRIHRSYAAQRHFIRRHNLYEVELDTSVKLPVGRSYKKSIKELS